MYIMHFIFKHILVNRSSRVLN